MKYVQTLEGIRPDMLKGGFFVHWPNPPTPETHFKLLQKSDWIVLALDPEVGQVVGFINAISDHVLTAYIPLLEVLPEYQNQGIGKKLVKLMLEQLKHLYMIDLLCDKHLQGFYEKLGMQKAHGMIIRHYENQSGYVEEMI